jgi:hypothetical protein
LPQLRTILHSLSEQPGYTLMRGVARFGGARRLVAGTRRLAHRVRTQRLLEQCEARMGESVFTDLDRPAFVRELSEQGVAFGLKLPVELVGEIRAWSAAHPCFADRDSRHGFDLAARDRAERALGKPILLAQHFNAARDCPAISRLIQDPALLWVACSYLGSTPAFVGANLWWTFPVRALESDRERHAHLFHRDVDDFRFFKFFFYLTDVGAGEGAHVCVVASHREPPRLRPGDRWNIRRYGDDEIEAAYPPARIREICGEAGTGFAENTLCIHKGLTPPSEGRLLLQLQYALFDYGVMHDRRDQSELNKIT